MNARRDFLLAASAAAVALGPWPASGGPALSLRGTHPFPASPTPPQPESAMPAPDARHDFDFFHGRWTVDNRRLRTRFAGADDWERFPGSLDCRPLLGGLGNLDEFRAGDVHGLSLRLFDPASGQWSDRWASARDGQLGAPALGRFDAGVGTFLGPDTHAGRAALNRMLFREIDAEGFVWEQAGSLDGGASWETNWVMHIRRAG